MSSEPTVFICRRAKQAPQTVKIQLDIREDVLEGFKQRSTGTPYTAKQIMQNILTNSHDGVMASK